MPETNSSLDRLVENGTIDSYSIENYDSFGKAGNLDSRGSNTQRLTLIFPNREKLVIDTYCSGSLQNTVLIISSEPETSG